MMAKNREEMIALLTEEYIKWEETETANIAKGSGFRGSNGMLAQYSFDDLFNEVAWHLLTRR